MKAYSEDLRKKVVQAVERRGTSKAEAAPLFGISLSSVKRYTRDATCLGECYRPPRGPRATPRLVAKTSAPYHLRDH
jgi:transposase